MTKLNAEERVEGAPPRAPSSGAVPPHKPTPDAFARNFSTFQQLTRLTVSLLLAIASNGVILAQPNPARDSSKPEAAKETDELLSAFDEEFAKLDFRNLKPDQDRRYQERIERVWMSKVRKEDEVIAILNELSNRTGFGVVSSDGLSKDEQKEALRISFAFANAKRHLKKFYWKEDGMNFALANHHYLKIIQDTRLSDGLRTSFLLDVDRYLQETKPRVYMSRAKPLRKALAMLAEDPQCPPAFRAQALRVIASRFRDDEVDALIKRSASSTDRDVRSRSLYALRYLRVDDALLRQLKDAYTAEAARDPELAYVVITTLRRLPGERRVDVLPVLTGLRDSETSDDLRKKLEWAIWALETEARHEKEKR